MLRFFRFFFALLIAILFIGFAIANRGAVSLNLFPLPYDVRLPQFLLALICFAFGALVGRLLLGLSPLRVQRLLKLERQRVEALEHELALLRTRQTTSSPNQP